MKAFSPKGTQIIGTYEMVPARAEIQCESFRKDADGSLQFEWEGETEVFWDGQEGVKVAGEQVYLDEEGNEWRESDLRLEA